MMIGTRLGQYEVLGPLGAGGMGEVYRARDTELKRDVALKVLPAAVAADPDRLARFQREAELLAALNHPHIAQVYGVAHDAGVRAIVMELVEGATLAERIARGPVPLDEALPIAQQLAEALEYLKPANIKLTPDGAVKVLDFGLAKAFAAEGVSTTADALGDSPTMRSPAVTEAGIILGTAAYMAPEQARGAAVDKRADIWAFGVVLFEMLTGRACFDPSRASGSPRAASRGDGGTVADVLAAVLTTDPDWTALPADTPPREGPQAAPARHRRRADRTARGSRTTRRRSRPRPADRTHTASVAGSGGEPARPAHVRSGPLRLAWVGALRDTPSRPGRSSCVRPRDGSAAVPFRLRRSESVRHLPRRQPHRLRGSAARSDRVVPPSNRPVRYQAHRRYGWSLRALLLAGREVDRVLRERQAEEDPDCGWSGCEHL
jgi:hypothetical protein